MICAVLTFLAILGSGPSHICQERAWTHNRTAVSCFTKSDDMTLPKEVRQLYWHEARQQVRFAERWVTMSWLMWPTTRPQTRKLLEDRLRGLK